MATRPTPEVFSFFDEQTFTVTFLVKDPDGSEAVVIDPVLDFDTSAGRTSTGSADRIIGEVQNRGLTVSWILETHAHADHLSAAPYLKEKLDAQIAIGQHITDVQTVFRDIFNLGPNFPVDGSQFDHLLADGDSLDIGGLTVTAMHTPGHTPACMTYVIGDAVFVGDTIFMPDYGTARCDFPGGDAKTLYQSIHRILALPPNTRIFVCHDYGPNGRPFAWETTVAAEKTSNIHVKDGVSEEDFVHMREERDATLSMPALILPSIQVNIRAGQLPEPEDNGVSYLKLPVDAL